ncbi:unnamed protein product [Schistosoma mattheei]|uniref:BRCT domain-containing protein n=3 Tax=Schistosoma mattheei TaxID=31246 RepID=A0AA85B2N2_9TREM|nr:unnamed protein product [Schistosoma mattheei]
MKRRVVFSESDSEQGKADSKTKYETIFREERKYTDVDDNQISCRDNSQQSIIDALRRQQELCKINRGKKANTIEAYFSQSVKPKKNVVSVDDFFGPSGTKSNAKPSAVVSTPPHSPMEIIPDTPILSPKTPLGTRGSYKSSPQINVISEGVKTTSNQTSSMVNESLNDSTDTAVKDRKHFWAYKARDGPRSLGSREIPKGTPDCLKGLNFLITGILECIEREDAANLIQNCGGKVLKTLGKKTDYLVVGREPGAAKIEKANNLKIKQITEEHLFEMIEKSSNIPLVNHKSNVCSSESSKKLEPVDANDSKQNLKSPKKSPKKNQSTKSPDNAPKSRKHESPNKCAGKSVMSSCSELPLTARPVLTNNSTFNNKTDRSHSSGLSKTPTNVIDKQDSLSKEMSSKLSELWVDKYKPTSIRSLIGQNGAQSPANRLLNWLSSWHSSFSAGLKAKAYSSAPPWGPSSSDDGKWARAALLSGPPGIGKTSTAILVCKELGYTYCEFNASDCRSKRCLSEEIGQSLGLRNLSHMAFGQASTLNSGRHVLIMDEVDGMAGNEDRGGMQELINMIKITQLPIICMCNDRQAIKIRSLANYCLDLRFHRPRVEQINNHDIRQVINNVQMWCSSGLIDSEGLKADALGARKDLHLNAFDVIRKVFAPDISGSQGSVATFNESLDLFFQDYNLIPLFVEENYLNVRVHNTHDDKKILQLMSQAASDIATADIISSTIRSSRTGSWSLLPVQGVFSTVSPGRTLRGSLPGGPGGVSFPSWFGKNSTQSRINRTTSELAAHLRLATHCGSSNPLTLLLDYATPISELITRPLKEGDIDSAIQFLINYQITREDVDSIMELTTWPNRPNRMLSVDSKVKAALTRTYNKSSHLLPYVISSSGSFKRKRGGGAPVSFEGEIENDSGLFDDDDEGEEQEDEKVDLKNDAMILIKKEDPKKRINTEKSKLQRVEQCSSSDSNNTKERGRGRGRGRANNISLLSMVANSKLRIGTHDGRFHADEILACAMLKHLPEYSNAEIIRTRDSSILSTCDIVVDVGGVFNAENHLYDHHQREFNLTYKDFYPNSDWDIKLSSAGLIYVHFGQKILSCILGMAENTMDPLVTALFDKMYSSFIVEIDAIDNGVPMAITPLRYSMNTSLSSRVNRMNPAWNQLDTDETICFHNALQLVDKEFITLVHFYADTWYPAREIVLNAVKNRYSIDSSGTIIYIEGTGCPWNAHFFEIEKSLSLNNVNEIEKQNQILFVIYQRKDSTWTIQAIPLDEHNNFSQRLPLPESWRGLRDEQLSSIVGLPDCIFVHSTGFLGVHKTRDGVLQMARLTIKMKENQ